MKDMDKELEEMMSARSEWKGSADHMWQRVEADIHRRQQRKWRLPSWGIATAAVLLIALVGSKTLISGNHLVQSSSLPGAQVSGHNTPAFPEQSTSQNTRPSLQMSEPNTSATPEQPTDRKRPAQRLVDFSILPDKETYAAEEVVHLTVRFRNVSTNKLTLGPEIPLVFISSMLSDYNSAHPAGDAIKLSWLAGRTIAPGEEVSGVIDWQQHGSLGWYRTSLGIVRFQAGKLQASIGGGGANPFFVAYPPGTVLVRTLDPKNAQVTHDGLTLSIRRIEFTERETKVSFHVTNLKAPAEFNLKIVRPEGEEGAVLGLSHKDSPEGGIDGWAEYYPTLADADHIELVLVTKRGDSPWQVRIPLK